MSDAKRKCPLCQTEARVFLRRGRFYWESHNTQRGDRCQLSEQRAR